METIRQDLRYAFRTLRKNPGFTLVAMLTLALGIGVNTAIFSVVNAVILNPLPYRDSEQLVMVFHDYPQINLKASVSAYGYEHYREHARSFERLTAFRGSEFNISGRGEPERIFGMQVTPDFFLTLGVRPALGRTFLPEEAETGRNRVLVLSDAFWHRRYGGEPGVLNTTLVVDNESCTIVGVMPPDFQFGRELGTAAEIWTPIVFTPEQRTPDRLTWEFLTVIGRMRPGVGVERARAEMDVIANNLRHQYMPGMDRNDWGLTVVSLRESLVGELRLAFWALLGAVAFVLLIACTNVANLLLVRAATRRKEMDIRSALGAGRWRIVRLLLTETVLLSVLAGVLGVGLAWVGVRFLSTLEDIRIPRAHEIGLDGRVVLFALAISLAAAVLAGLAPSLHRFEGKLQDTLREGGRPGTGAVKNYVRAGLVVLETALALILLVGAGLMARSFARLQDVNPGFDPGGVLSFHLSLPESKYSEGEEIEGFYSALLGKLRSLPGVRSCGAISTLPMSDFQNSGSFRIEGQEIKQGESAPHGARWRVTPGYFETMRIPLVRGRYLTQYDRPTTAKVVLIDENLARKYWPGKDPVGKRITFDGTGPDTPTWREIVGVVAHVKHEGLEGESRAQYYVPQSQSPRPQLFVVLRSSMPMEPLVASVRSAVKEMDSGLPIARLSAMEEVVGRSLAKRRFTTSLLALFAFVAVLLATIGLYGVISYSVTVRTQEIGIRMALGAERKSVLGLVLRNGFWLMFLGLAIGLAGSLALTRFLSGLLYGVTPTDPMTLGLVCTTLAAVSLLACLVPARRATRVDPMVALRYE